MVSCKNVADLKSILLTLNKDDRRPLIRLWFCPDGRGRGGDGRSPHGRRHHDQRRGGGGRHSQEPHQTCQVSIKAWCAMRKGGFLKIQRVNNRSDSTLFFKSLTIHLIVLLYI